MSCRSPDATELIQMAGPWYPKGETAPTLIEVVRMSKEEVDELIKKLQNLHYYHGFRVTFSTYEHLYPFLGSHRSLLDPYGSLCVTLSFKLMFTAPGVDVVPIGVGSVPAKADHTFHTFPT
jgi:hypothetical protein